jgi:hypothetical protein
MVNSRGWNRGVARSVRGAHCDVDGYDEALGRKMAEGFVISGDLTLEGGPGWVVRTLD